MADFHPTSTAGSGKSQVVNAYISKKETKELIINCPHCGLPNDDLVEPNPDSQGESNKIIDVAHSTPSGSTNIKERQRTAGCRFCGLNFRESSYAEPFFSDVNLTQG